MRDRIHQLMESLHMNQQAFANRSGIATASLSNIFSGRTRPTLLHVEALMKSFPSLNLQWLLSGEGQMFVTDNDSASSQSHEDSNTSQQANVSELPLFQDSATQSQSSAKMADLTLPFDDSPAVSQGKPKIVQNFGTPQKTSSQSSPVAVSPIVTPTPQRKITEIRVFYDDQTWESFVPKKN